MTLSMCGDWPSLCSHHFALHQPGIKLVGRDEIEIRSRVGHDFFARRLLSIQHSQHCGLQTREGFVQHGSVKRFFILEVVIEKRLIYTCLARDRVRACAGNTILGKLVGGRRQNGSPALLRLAPGAHAADIVPLLAILFPQFSALFFPYAPFRSMGMSRHYLINQLVRLYRTRQVLQNLLAISDAISFLNSRISVDTPIVF